MSPQWSFETVPGLFLQSDLDASDEAAFDTFATPYFGLKSKDWSALDATVKELRQNQKPGEAYKVFFLARHGEGFHNVAEAKYGTEAWDAKWSLLNGDAELVWGPDPELTPLGLSQAEAAHKGWARELQEHGAILPERFIVSPFIRAADTGKITWQGLVELSQFIIKEQWRETIGEHTCDKRSTKSAFTKRYPFQIESGFTEEDELWKADKRETPSQQTARLDQAMSDYFDEDHESLYVSLSAHSGTIRAILEAVHFPKTFILMTGGMIPVVVKGTKRSG